MRAKSALIQCYFAAVMSVAIFGPDVRAGKVLGSPALNKSVGYLLVELRDCGIKTNRRSPMGRVRLWFKSFDDKSVYEDLENIRNLVSFKTHNAIMRIIDTHYSTDLGPDCKRILDSLVDEISRQYDVASDWLVANQYRRDLDDMLETLREQGKHLDESIKETKKVGRELQEAQEQVGPNVGRLGE